MQKQDKIAILGYGVEGKAMLGWLVKHGFANVTVCDANVDLEMPDNEDGVAFPDGVSSRLGKDYLEGLEEFDVIFRSPGIKWLEPKLQIAIDSGVEVTSPTAFFLDQCPGKIVGVSGTKGKGTTCTLIYEILKQHFKEERMGRNVFLGGNIGVAAVSFLDEVKGDDVVVLEMSSFQLQDVKKSPHFAVLLNTTRDHLDYHADVDEYLVAKEGLLAHQNKDCVAVLNRDYEYAKYYRGLVKGELREVSVEGTVKDGAFVKGKGSDVDAAIFCARDGDFEEVMKTKDVKLIGAHNLENVLPATVVARELGVAIGDIAAVVMKFAGLPHRLEFVTEVDGVKFFNDSFATTTETSMATVDSFDEPTVLIAGGSDKGLDYGDWAVKILTKPSLKTVILIGDTAEKMEKEIGEAEGKLGEAEGSPTKVVKRGNLEEAVLEAFAEAENGGVVVMSPAAASFDQFENYKKRGEEFRELVRGLK